MIICGAEGSFVNFVEQLRRCDPMSTPVVVLHPRRPSAAWTALKALGPIHYVAGTLPCNLRKWTRQALRNTLLVLQATHYSNMSEGWNVPAARWLSSEGNRGMCAQVSPAMAAA